MPHTRIAIALLVVFAATCHNVHSARPNVVMWQENWAVREGDWKLIRHNPKLDGAEVRTLHNLSEPNPEVRDHAADKPQLAKHLQSLHDEFENDVFARQTRPRAMRDPKRKLDL